MHLRTLKKKCRQAMTVLIEQHGYRPEAFVKADGNESIYAPHGMEAQFVSGSFLNPGPLKGTILLYERTSYEYDEWDYALPSEALAEIKHWENIGEATCF